MTRLFLVAALGVVAGCAGPGATTQQLLARATFDLECPQPRVRVHDLGDRVRGVEGCGRRLSYVEVCETRPDGTHCAWVINAPAWAYGPPADKRPPTPPQTFFYTNPPPQPGGRRYPPGSYPRGHEPFPTNPGPSPLPQGPPARPGNPPSGNPPAPPPPAPH